MTDQPDEDAHKRLQGDYKDEALEAKLVGNYEFIQAGKDKKTLSLNKDGTSFYSEYSEAPTKTKMSSGAGTWSLKQHRDGIDR